MDLTNILIDALEARRDLINQTAKRWPDRPIQIEMSWHPKMGKLDIVVKAVDHLPHYKPVFDPLPDEPPDDYRKS